MLIPAPRVPPESVPFSKQSAKFTAKYHRRKGSWSWAKCEARARGKIVEKLHHWHNRPLHEFRTGVCKPRKWTGKLPPAPQELSEDIKNQLADYFDIDKKIRIFGYQIDNKFLIIWISTDHKHSK